MGTRSIPVNRGTMNPSKLTAKQWNPRQLDRVSRNQLALKVGGWEGGICFEIPFFVFVGKVRKPRALLIAGIHGDEYEGVAALHDFASQLHPDELCGTLTIVPISNPQAFYAGTRRNPVDCGDLNRLFPGDPKGTISERLAALLFHNLVTDNDAILSMHCWSKEAVSVPYVEYFDGKGRVGRESLAIAHAVGLEFLHPYRWEPGLLVAAASRAGIPSVEVEVGGLGSITDSGQRTYLAIIRRFLAYLGMLKNPSLSGQPVYASKTVNHISLRADYAGLFRSHVAIGQRVRKGSEIGTIHDLAGKRLEKMTAPCEGIVGILRVFASVLPGDQIAQLFWENSD
jgi:predicted deacylase